MLARTLARAFRTAHCGAAVQQLPVESATSLVAKRTRTSRSGPPARSGVSGNKITVFGATGFLGRYVVSLLGSEGHQVIIPFRGDDTEVRHLKVMGDYGNIVTHPFHPNDEDSIRTAVSQSDIVINLIGKDYETTHYLPWLINQSYEDVHVRLAERIARISTEEGANVLVHTSALAANHDSISPWARSKADGERAVLDVCPGATIVRPATLYGAEDKFLNMYARMYQNLPRVPLIDGGERKVQPLYVLDLAQAITKIALSTDPDVCLSQQYDLAGPDEYTYREVVEYVFETIRALNPAVSNMPPLVAEAVGTLVGMFPTPEFSADTFRRMQEDCVLNPDSDAKRLHDLGIAATSMEAPGHHFLYMYRSGSHFLDVMENA